MGQVSVTVKSRDGTEFNGVCIVEVPCIGRNGKSYVYDVTSVVPQIVGYWFMLLCVEERILSAGDLPRISTHAAAFVYLDNCLISRKTDVAGCDSSIGTGGSATSPSANLGYGPFSPQSDGTVWVYADDGDPRPKVFVMIQK